MNLNQKRMGQESAEPTEVDSELEALRDRIEAALGDPLEEQWTAVLDEWSDGTPSERRAVRASVSRSRDRVLDRLRPLRSLEELERGLALGYVEMKCRWTRLHTQIQHRTIQDDQVAGSLLYRTACVSLIVQALDPLLIRESVEEVASVLVESLS